MQRLTNDLPPLLFFSVRAVLLLDTDGNRLVAKYFQPPHAPPAPVAGAAAGGAAPAAQPLAHLGHGAVPAQLSARNPFNTHKEQRTFEKAIWDKTRRASGRWDRWLGRAGWASWRSCKTLV